MLSTLLIFSLFAANALDRPVSISEVRTADGVSLHVWRVAGQEPPMVVPMRGWHEAFLDQLPNQAFVFYDPRNRGRSSVAPDSTVTLEQDLADLEAIRSGLGLESIHLMGASYYGGMVAAYAARWPEHVVSVVMVAPISLTQAELYGYAPEGKAERVAEADRARLEELQGAGVQDSDPLTHCRAYRRTVTPTLIHDLSQMDRVPDPCTQPNEWPANFSRWGAAIFADLGVWDLGPVADGVVCPVLVIQGKADLIVPPSGAQRWVARLAQSQLVEIPLAGHIPWYENPATFFSIVAGFLAGK